MSPPVLGDRGHNESSEHQHHSHPLARQQGVAVPQHREQDGKELACGGDQRVDQRPKGLDGIEDEQLPHSPTQTEQQHLVAGCREGQAELNDLPPS